MTAPQIVVVGAGGHGKVVADVLLQAGERVLGFLDDARAAGTLVLGLPILGPVTWLATHRAKVALGVGDNIARQRVAGTCERLGAPLIAAVHPRAAVAPSATIEPGVAIMALAVVNPDAVIGRGAIINTGAVIEHDCAVGAFAHVSPNATLGGECRVGALAQVGIGATMLPRTAVGARSVVGGGALVARDLPDDVVARGVPARVRRNS